MRFMAGSKHKAAAIGLVAIVGMAVVGFTPTAARALNSDACTNGGGTETTVPNPAILLGVERQVTADGWTYTTVCWRTTPPGSTSPEAAGGFIRIGQHLDGRARLWCAGDRTPSTMVTVDCDALVTPTDPNPASAGMTVTGSLQVGSFSPVPIGQTGTEAGQLSTTNTSSATGVQQIGSCLWVHGMQLLPRCNSLNADPALTHGDTPKLGTTGSECVVRTGPTTCWLWIPRYYVVAGGDTAVSTVTGTVAGNNLSIINIPYTCAGFCP